MFCKSFCRTASTKCCKCQFILTREYQLFLLKTLLMGQGLSALICGTAVTSQYLASTWNLDVPMLQSFINYTLLFFTYTTALLFRTGLFQFLFNILINVWDKGIAHFLFYTQTIYMGFRGIVTTLTYFMSVSTASNILLGDGLVILSASLYAISNVCQEYTVKNRSRVEFLGMLGLFGMLISGIQLGILEHAQIANIQWTWQIVLLLSGFGLCMYALYSCMPLVVKLTSATAVNLSLLTADLFSLFCGLFLFQYSFSGLYIVSLVTIMVGFITFNAVPTPSPPTESVCEEGGYDNQGAELDEEGQVGYAVDNTCEDQGKEKSESSSRGKSHSSETRCVIISRTEM
uniref:Info solute carrier family 35 member F2, like n=1 Tax=Astyanax mexicanus TaxID=7994 RepID=A0A8B9HB43_ASTMX